MQLWQNKLRAPVQGLLQFGEASAELAAKCSEEQSGGVATKRPAELAEDLAAKLVAELVPETVREIALARSSCIIWGPVTDTACSRDCDRACG